MAIRFTQSGSGNLLRITGLPNFNSVYTLMAHFYRISDLNSFGCLWYLGNDSVTQYDFVFLTSDGTTLSISDQSFAPGGTPPTGSTLPATTWTHIAAVREDPSTLKLYFNGALDITNTANNAGTSRTAQRLEMGTNLLTNNPINARVKGIKLFDAALTQQEIQQEMHTLLPRRLSNVNGWYPCFYGSGERTRDYSGNGRDWTPNGTVLDEDDPPISYGAPSRRMQHIEIPPGFPDPSNLSPIRRTVKSFAHAARYYN